MKEAPSIHAITIKMKGTLLSDENLPSRNLVLTLRRGPIA